MREKDKAEILEKCAGKMSDTSLQRGESNIDFEYKAAAADEFVDAVEFVPQKNLVELPVNLHSKEGNNGAKVNFLGLGSEFRVDSKEKNIELLNLSVRNSGFPVDELMASSEPIHYEGLTSERYIDVESKSILGSNKRVVETGGFEAGIPEGSQTCEHTLLAFTLGVKEIICCSNKRDATTPKYLKARGIDGARGGLGKMFYCLGGQLPNRILIVDFSKTKAPKVAENFEEMMNNSRY